MYIKPAIQLAGLAVGGLAYSAATMATMFTTAEFLKKRKIARQKRKAEAQIAKDKATLVGHLSYDQIRKLLKATPKFGTV